MKATLLLLVVVAAIFSSVYADWTISTLENGVYVTGIATSISTQDCHYAKLTVPAGTTHVQIDVETSESNYVSVTGGFNVAPAADRSGLNSYSFSDNNVILGSPRRYLMCTFNPMASFGASNNIAFGSVNSGTTCAAFSQICKWEVMFTFVYHHILHHQSMFQLQSLTTMQPPLEP